MVCQPLFFLSICPYLSLCLSLIVCLIPGCGPSSVKDSPERCAAQKEEEEAKSRSARHEILKEIKNAAKNGNSEAWCRSFLYVFMVVFVCCLCFWTNLWEIILEALDGRSDIDGGKLIASWHSTYYIPTWDLQDKSLEMFYVLRVYKYHVILPFATSTGGFCLRQLSRNSTPLWLIRQLGAV